MLSSMVGIGQKISFKAPGFCSIAGVIVALLADPCVIADNIEWPGPCRLRILRMVPRTHTVFRHLVQVREYSRAPSLERVTPLYESVYERFKEEMLLTSFDELSRT